MAKLTKIWFGMLTHDEPDAGTDDRIALTFDNNQITFIDSPQSDQDRGQANLYERDVEAADIFTEALNESSIRVIILGGDAWLPEHAFVWGMPVDGRSPRPLAIETEI